MIHSLLLRCWRQLSLATVAGIAAGLSGAALVMVINRRPVGEGQLPALALTFFGLCVLHVIARTTSTVVLMRMAQALILELRVSMSRRLLRTPLPTLHTIGQHGLLAILTRDIETLVNMSHIAPAAAANAIVVLACLSYIAWLSWPVFAILVATMVLGALGFHLLETLSLKRLHQVREQVDHLYRHFRDLVGASRELKLNARRGTLFVERQIVPEATRYRDDFVAAMTRYAWLENLGDVLFYLTIGVLLFVLPQWLPGQRDVLSAAAITVLYLVSPVSMLVGAMPSLREVAIAAGRIRRLDGSLGGAELPPGPNNPFVGSGPLTLELRGVCRRSDVQPGADDRRFELGPLDLQLHQGEIVFIVGGNGSGKTTLGMLLLGLYEAEHGSICLNGLPLTPDNLVHYRSHFSAVLSDFHLFEQLFEEAGAETAQRAADYLDQFGLAHKVRIADGRFSTIDLSSGQRRRLALISSYLEDRPIYLFDEWAADQDPGFKRVFYTQLLPELKARGKLVIVITHDEAYFDRADRCVKLCGGRLVARQPAAEVEAA